jgi:threonine aldolase
MVDLRSDTLTQPSAGMRAAIAAAVVGDEQKREDPTVNELERRAAELLGHEAALYLPTATMANQIALLLLTERGTEMIADETSHIVINEVGGPAVHAGLTTRALPSVDGRFDADQVREAVASRTGVHMPPPSVVCVEDTHNSSGGRVWPLDELRAVTDAARELGVATHLDGARVMNAAVALGVPVAEIAGLFDTATLCLSKGLGCPLGALLAGPADLLVKGRRLKHQFGGAMRQAGIVAAAGVYAFEHNIDRLADDHARARRLGEAWAAAGVPVDLAQVETNFVQVDVGPLGLTKDEAMERMRADGVLLSPTVHPTKLRAVTHLDVSDDDVEHACDAVPRALGVLAAAV